MSHLLRSRKFLVLVLDTLVAAVLHFTGRYAIPSAAEEITFLTLALQPVFMAVIAGIAYEDQGRSITGAPAPAGNPLLALLRSRKFLVLVLDTVISVATFFSARRLAPEVAEDVRYAIAALQPVVVVVIGAIAYEDRARIVTEAWRGAVAKVNPN